MYFQNGWLGYVVTRWALHFDFHGGDDELNNSLNYNMWELFATCKTGNVSMNITERLIFYRTKLRGA